MMYFWVRVSKNLHYRKLLLFYGDLNDYKYFESRQGYPCWFSESPGGGGSGEGSDWWSLNAQSGTTDNAKKIAAKKAAIDAALAVPWVVIEETYETQAFYRP